MYVICKRKSTLVVDTTVTAQSQIPGGHGSFSSLSDGPLPQMLVITMIA